MPRLIEVREIPPPDGPLAVRVGDVLAIAASGGRVRSGDSLVEILGAFRTALVALNGEVVAPEGAPDAVLVRAKSAGRAELEISTGDPFHGPGAVVMEIEIR